LAVIETTRSGHQLAGLCHLAVRDTLLRGRKPFLAHCSGSYDQP
jgi:hypothetical protein